MNYRVSIDGGHYFTVRTLNVAISRAYVSAPVGAYVEIYSLATGEERVLAFKKVL